MFNVAVFRIKDLIKYFALIMLALIIIIAFTRCVSTAKQKKLYNINLKDKIQMMNENSHLELIDKTIPQIKETSASEKEIKDETNISKKREEITEKIMQVELAQISSDDENTIQDSQEAPLQTTEDTANTESNETIENVETQIVTPEPIDAVPTDTYGSVQIRNQTGYVLSEEMLTPNIEFDASNIIIFHTHTCESYTQTEKNKYEPSGNYRTLDLNFTVARVGDELEKNLLNYGYNVIHDKTYHDYPAYTGSYTRSLNTVEGLLKNNKADVVIDLHRDAIGSNNNYAPTVKIGDDYCAQLMFVIGSNGGGLWHPNWNQNLKFAIKLQQKAEEMYPRAF